MRADDFCWNYWRARPACAAAAGAGGTTTLTQPLVSRRHVPGQYTLLRTPAQDFFEPKLFRRGARESSLWRLALTRHRGTRSKLEEALLAYGREALGCGGISPIWLSYYVSGCRQELHADVPHGPWAFVLSLTPTPRAFTGGETMILQPHVLDYFRDFDPARVVEAPQLLVRRSYESRHATRHPACRTTAAECIFSHFFRRAGAGGSGLQPADRI